MMDITVKTLDGQNRTYSIPEKLTVKEFKEKIANSISIPADVQRLIFQGRVMQDEKLLKDYDVHGKVIHVVQRLPPSARTPGTSGGATSTTSTPPGGATARDMNRILIGSFNMPTGTLDSNNIQNVVQQAVTNMGEMGRNARVSTNVSNDGSSLDVHIHLGQIPGATESESQLRINHARRMLRLAREKLDRLERGETENQESSASNGQSVETSTSPMDTTEDEEVLPSTSTNQETPSTSTATTTTQSETSTQSTSQEVPTTSQSNPPTDSQTSGSDSQEEGSQNQPRGPIRPNISVLASVMEEVHEVNRRLQPQLERYQQIVREDAQLSPQVTRQQQTVCNLVAEVLHLVSHCYHSLSDLLVDLNEPSPRQLYTAILPLAIPTAVIQQTIPVHAQINVGSPRLVQRNMGTQSTVPTSTQSTATSQASTHAASQTAPAPATETNSIGVATEPVPAGVTSEPGSTSTTTGAAPSGTTSTGGPTVTSASTDPYVFVEVGPDHAVTVNSITAHVISSDGEIPNTSASNTGSTTTGPQGARNNLPADFFQNLVSSLMQAHAAQAGGATTVTNTSGTQTTSSASTSGTQTTNTATNSSGTQTGAGPRTSAFIMPGLPGGIPGLGQGIPGLGQGIPGLGQGIPGLGQGIPGLGAGIPGLGARNPGAMDPFLQCCSRHFLPSRERTTQNQSQSRSTSAPNNQNTGREFRSTGPEAFADVMINILSDMNTHLQGGRNTTGAPSSTTSTTGSATATTSASGTPSNNNTQTSRPATSSTTTSSAATSSTTTSTAGTPPMFNPYAGMMSGMVETLQGMMNPQQGAAPSFPRMPMAMPMPGLAAMFGQMAQGMQGARPPASTTAGPRPATGTAPRPATGAAPEPAYVQQLRSFLQTGSNLQSSTSATTTTPTSSTSAGGAGGRPPQPMTDEAFTQLVQGIGNMVTQTALGNPPTETISDFLSNLGEGYSSSSGGFINDIFNCVSTHLTFPDLIQVFYGNRQPLNRVRVPLQQFIRERVLCNKEATDENIEQSVDRLLDEMTSEELQAVENVSEVKPGIDLIATLRGFFRKQLSAVCRLVMNADETNTNFGEEFYEKVRQVLAELLVLSRSCLVGGQPALERLVQNRLTSITAGTNPMIQQWMVAVTTQQINQFLPTITVQESDVRHYIVKTSDKKKDENKKPPEKKETVASTSASPMDTSSPVTSLGAAEVDSPESMEVENGAPDAAVSSTSQKPQANVATKVKVKETVTNGNQAESPGAAAGNEAWKSEIPQDWVPIITNDVEKQKHQRPQPPLSDTYLQGMPAKRRKLMSHDGQMNLSSAAQTVPESIKRAMAAAGVEPISSVENLTNEARDNKELEQAFDEQVASSINDRLESDSDYKSERFPNAEQYYRKNKK